MYCFSIDVTEAFCLLLHNYYTHVLALLIKFTERFTIYTDEVYGKVY